MANDKDLELKVALSFVKGLSPEIVKAFPDAGIELQDFFELPVSRLRSALNLSSSINIDAYQRGEAVFEARKELEFIKKHSIKVLYLHDEDYPWRLFELSNPPAVIYCLGNCNLNSDRNVSIVGTRRCTNAGIEFTNGFLDELSPLFPDLCVISGLAYGIDSVSHAAALRNRRPTIGVLAHGLDMIYPNGHRNLAKEIISSGGALISEYPSKTRPYKGRFLERNRIVAGLSDATIVIESEIKGGAMSTANTAFINNREVFAIPGRPSDIMSSGCNHLIRKCKAHLLSSVSDFLEEMNWSPAGLLVDMSARCLFPELNGDFKIVYDFLRFKREPASIDAIHAATALPVSVVLSVLGELEFDGVVTRLPGNRYEV